MFRYADYSVVFNLKMDSQIYLENQIEYGINVYNVVVKGLENLVEGNTTMDYRAVHLLFESKKAIFNNRLNFIIGRYQLKGEVESLVKEYKKVVKLVNAARNKYLKQTLLESGDGVFFKPLKDKNAIRKIIENINAAKELESTLAVNIYEKLFINQ